MQVSNFQFLPGVVLSFHGLLQKLAPTFLASIVALSLFFTSFFEFKLFHDSIKIFRFLIFVQIVVLALKVLGFGAFLKFHFVTLQL